MLPVIMTQCAYTLKTAPDLKTRILNHDMAAPRYTSYPSAPFFKADFEPLHQKVWLEGLPEGEGISLYIHIPFCKQLCYYCGCHTFVANKAQMVTDYLASLYQELALLADRLPARMKLTHLHFGGGSPTYLSATQFTELMEQIRKHFRLSEGKTEVAIEADPRNLGEARIAAYARENVTRISLGVQDIDARVMEAVNRAQPFHLSWSAVQLARDYGIHEINLDLMYGLPGQTTVTIARGVETLLSLQPDRVAFFGYAHVPWMKKHMGMMGGLHLPDASERFDLYETGRAILLQAGYLPVGIDHFVRPTDSMARALANRTLQRNFQGYTTDAAHTLIGVGASAISRFNQGFTQNIADLRLYHKTIAEGRLPLNKGLELTKCDKIQSRVISEIMCYMGVDLAQIRSIFGLNANYFDQDVAYLAPLLEDGLIALNGDNLRIHHPHVARLAALAFDRRHDHHLAAPRHSKVI
ncbi:MAG: oxygen-independent coproporphyrinogen III oxidase [Pseudobdellovibrionaceae bacterium]